MCQLNPTAPTAPAAPLPPAFSDDEVLGAVRGYLEAPGMPGRCKFTGGRITHIGIVRGDPSNRDKYYVTVPNDPRVSWTFIGSLGRVISTSKGFPGC